MNPPILQTATARPSEGTIQPSPLLQQKTAALRRRHLLVAVLTGVAMALAVGIELLALAMFFDWWLDLPWGPRLVSLIAQLAVFTFIILRMVVRPLARQPDDDELALIVERARPEFRGRLIAALQLTRSPNVAAGTSAVMIDALVEETEAYAQPVDFPKIVPHDRLRRFGMLALMVLIMGLGGFIYGRAITVDLLKRVFLSTIAVPRKTRIIVPEGNKTIGRGDNVRLEAFAQGIIPATGRVEVRHRTRRAQTYPLEQNRDHKIHFGRTIENVQDSFTYMIFLNDGRSDIFTITTIPRPTVATMECEQLFPAYTRLQPQKRVLGDLSLLAGSTLKLSVVATKDLEKASLKLSGLEIEVPMQLDSAQPRHVTGQFTVPPRGMNGFSIQMLDTENMESRDAAVYRVDVIPDKAPVVKITYPERKEELLTRHAIMIVGIDALDDFAISRARLRYKVDTVDNGADNVIELDLEGQNPQRLRRRHEWRLGDFRPPLSEGSSIEYWLEVEDNNDATGPGLTATEHQLARIVSEAEKRADLLNRAGDTLGSISDVAIDQEKLNRTLGAIIREKTGR
jgi:hypothetical protein